MTQQLSLPGRPGRLGLPRPTGGGVATAILVVAAVLAARVTAEVAVVDSLRFAVYLTLWVVLPGTLLWRLVDPGRDRGPRPLAEDLTFGALLGLVAEAPVYLVGLVLGVPWLYLLWPLAWGGLLLVRTRRRGTGLVHRGDPAAPSAWPWTTAGLTAVLLVWFSRYHWSRSPVSDAGLRQPYVDEPFHLALVSGLRHVWPPEYSYVAGTSLEYHWLSHLHVAAASWASGVEPVVLLRSLSLPTVFVLSVLALGHVAVRLTGAGWTRPATLALLLTGPAILVGWAPRQAYLLGDHVVLSPSSGFGLAVLVLVVLVVVEALRDRRLSARTALLLVVLLTCVAGAKSTTLPAVAAGVLGATFVCTVVERRVMRVGVVLLALCAGTFIVATRFFVGGGSHGVRVDLLALTVLRLGPLPEGTGLDDVSFGVRLVLSTWLVGLISLGGLLVGLLVRRGWRRPEQVFMASAFIAGLGASLTFGQLGYSQFYFYYGMLPVLVLGAVLGLHRLTSTLPASVARQLTALAIGLGSGVGVVVTLVARSVLPTGQPESLLMGALVFAALPAVLTAVLVLALAPVATGLVTFRARRSDLSRRSLGLSVCCVAVGLGLVNPLLSGLTDLAAGPAPESRATGADMIGESGPDVARWVREKLPQDALLATNAHCRTPSAPPCDDARNFWMAGWTERTFLVEGWAYVSWSTVGLRSPAGDDTIAGPFWDPARLALNDAVMDGATTDNVTQLQERYGVGWLLVDTRYPWSRGPLLEHAIVVHEQGDYVVLELGG